MGCGTSRDVLGERTWTVQEPEDGADVDYPEIVVMRGMPLPLTWFNGGYERKEAPDNQRQGRIQAGR